MRRTKASKYSRKDSLEVGDICTVSTQGLKKVYFPHLPVLVTGTSVKGDVTKYTVASKYGYLRGTFVRKDLSHRKYYIAAILNLRIIYLYRMLVMSLLWVLHAIAQEILHYCTLFL